MVRIIYYRYKCIGCNACVEALSSRWRISRKDGKSVLIGGKEKGPVFLMLVDNGEYLKNKMAANNCPMNIIRLEKI